ncbi:hypothetical protein, partial [Salmonella sp. s60093]|uniref:hypothetical protein n=1 Tax=Salmonella sp. s60093 TaxID=3159721 RepID=UPI00397F3999
EDEMDETKDPAGSADGESTASTPAWTFTDCWFWDDYTRPFVVMGGATLHDAAAAKATNAETARAPSTAD